MLNRIAFVTCLAFVTGCAGTLDPKAQRAADTFDCLVASVAPYVGDAVDVAELVTDAVKGRASIPEALHMLGATADDVRAVRKALAACLPQPDPAPLQPEPAEYRADAGAP